MITLTTSQLSLSLPDRFLSNVPLSAPEAQALERIFRFRLRALIASWLDKGMSASEVQANIDALVPTYEFTIKAPDAIDPVAIEAQRLARDIVIRHLKKNGLDLEEEAIARHTLPVANLASVRTRAEEIVTLRKAAAERTLAQAVRQ